MSDFIFSKKFHLWMMWINGFFVLCNALLMYVADYPTVNFMCALISLLGFSASYVMYKTQS
jgi:hypothetical protein